MSEQTISKIRQNAPNIVLYETADLQIDLFKSIEEEKIDYAIVNSIEYSLIDTYILVLELHFNHKIIPSLLPSQGMRMEHFQHWLINL